MKEEIKIVGGTPADHESGEGQATQILLLDVSSTGALIECERYIKPGATAIVQLPLGEDPQEVQCSVVHCAVHEIQHISGRPDRTIYRVGLKLDGLTPTCKTIIQDLIKERLYHERREQPRLYVGRESWLKETT